MSWALRWHPAALHGFHDLPLPTAERLDAALLRFAATGEGGRWVDPPRVRVRVTGAEAYLVVDRGARAVYVTGVYRRP